MEIKMAVVISPVSLCCLFLCYAVSPESSSVERAAIRPQKLSTKLPGKRPVLPFLCNVPLYQPSSRFLCTNTMSPSFSSISASLCGGYGTTTRYLSRGKGLGSGRIAAMEERGGLAGEGMEKFKSKEPVFLCRGSSPMAP